MANPLRMTRDDLAQHAAFVRARLRRLGVPAGALDDAAQDVFEVLVRRIADYDPQRPLRAWMAGIARRVARRHREPRAVPFDLPQREADPSPEERVARAQAWGLLERFLAELEPERWSVFVLAEVEGLRVSEIAAELGLNVHTARSRLQSARASFERVVRRQHARERRAFAVAPGLLWRAGAWVLGCLGVAMWLAVGTPGIRAGEPEPERKPDGGVVQGSSTPSIDSRASDPANARLSPEHDGWHHAGRGFSLGSMLESERRYRFDGDELTFETTYIADDETDAIAIGHIELDGFDLVAGELEWSFPIAAGETRSLLVRAKASRTGVVGLRLAHEHGSLTLRWVHENDALRHCAEHECIPSADAFADPGEPIEVDLVNTCSARVEFVLIAGEGRGEVPEHVRIHSLEPDEHRRATIGTNQWIRRVDEAGRTGGGVRTSDPGSIIRFFDTLDAECGGLSTSTRSSG